VDFLSIEFDSSFLSKNFLLKKITNIGPYQIFDPINSLLYFFLDAYFVFHQIEKMLSAGATKKEGRGNLYLAVRKMIFTRVL